MISIFGNSQAHLLDRYLLLKYLKTFLLALVLIIVIVITFDVSEKLDDFLGNHAPFSEVVFKYYLNFIPGFVNLYSPLFIFISVIFFTSKLAGNTEIIAILGSGISYRRMLRPYLHGSIIIALIIFAFANFLIPYSNRYLIEFEDQYIHTHRQNYYSNLHFQSKQGTQIYAGSYDVPLMRAYQFHQDTYDQDQHLVDRLTAEYIFFDTLSGKWVCSQLCRHTINGTKERLTHTVMDTLALNVSPDDFDQHSQRIETMNSYKLHQHIQREKMRGSNAVVTAQIELYQRLFNPLAIIVMTFIGVGVSSRKSRGGTGVHLAIGITLAFGFVVFMKISNVFAINGNLPPALAVLLPQIIFGIIAAYAIKFAPK